MFHTDADLSFPPARVVEAIERALRLHATGDLHAPPRFGVDAVGDDGAIVFTAGASPDAIGFRVYETFPSSAGDRGQLVAVWDGRTGEFRGVVAGNRIGLYRTAGINAVAIDTLARPDASVLGVLGTGTQARAGAELACAVREFERVQVFSPTREHREAFAEVPVEVPIDAVDSPEEAVRGADVLYCATTSSSPVFEADWLAPGAHVCTLGPKYEGVHELPRAVAERASVVATDSLAQVEGYADYRDPYFLPTGGMVELGALLDAGVPERGPEDLTLFCSVGLAGTEVVLADALLG
jgi:alanine dehydrogenase